MRKKGVRLMPPRPGDLGRVVQLHGELYARDSARGQGLGRRLTRACIAFARRAGYRKMVLWPQSHLAAARAIYEREGFRKVAEEEHRSFGKRLVAETWELRLEWR